MITANECRIAVENRKSIEISKSFNALETAIIKQVNKGWLFINYLVHNVDATPDEINAIESLGFKVDINDGVINWM